MLKIRLKRVGRKHDPSFRIIVTEKHLGPKSGKYIENVGFYNVQKGDKQVDGERIKYWISKGAQVSPTVHNMLISEGVLEGKKINVLPKKKPIEKADGGDGKGGTPTPMPTPTPTTSPTVEVIADGPVVEETVEEAVVEEQALIAAETPTPTEAVSPNPADGQEETPAE